jgi:hypothetical protein
LFPSARLLHLSQPLLQLFLNLYPRPRRLRLILRKRHYVRVKLPYENRKKSAWPVCVVSRRKKRRRKHKGSVMKLHVCRGDKKKPRARQNRSVSIA